MLCRQQRPPQQGRQCCAAPGAGRPLAGVAAPRRVRVVQVQRQGHAPLEHSSEVLVQLQATLENSALLFSGCRASSRSSSSSSSSKTRDSRSAPSIDKVPTQSSDAIIAGLCLAIGKNESGIFALQVLEVKKKKGPLHFCHIATAIRAMHWQTAEPKPRDSPCTGCVICQTGAQPAVTAATLRCAPGSSRASAVLQVETKKNYLSPPCSAGRASGGNNHCYMYAAIRPWAASDTIQPQLLLLQWR